MRKRPLKIGLAILFFVTLCCGCRSLLHYLFPLGFEGQPDEVIKRDEFYTIDSQIILQNIVQGQPFKLVATEEPEDLFHLPETAPAVRWTQADYLKVADAVARIIWGEAIVNWNLEGIGASVDCKDVEFGLQDMSFKFFRIKERDGVKVLTTRSIAIHPKSDLVSLLEVDTSPVTPLERFGNIAVEEIIPAEEALRIAEENGGQQARSGFDDCKISLSIIAGVHQGNWSVAYVGPRRYHFFSIMIDANGMVQNRLTP
jgi:hypothetical protein